MRFDALEEWLQWQEGLHPKAIDLRLERVSEVWRRLRPEGLPGKAISVAGTNGKGSCVAMAEAILEAAGHTTGSYTSPHLVRYNERIRLSGEEAGDEEIMAAFERIDQVRGGIPLTYFEFGTLAALELFAQYEVDVALLEVGLGGRLDAVNVIDADAALITSIDIDHTEWLGGTREEIGREKAGILRPGRAAVYGSTDLPASVARVAEEKGVPLYVAGRDFRHQREAGGWRWIGPGRVRSGLPRPSLPGEVQLDNAAAVLMILETMHEDLPMDQAAIREGLQSAHLPGRLQRIPGEVPVILDVAHNPHAARALAAALRAWPVPGRTHAVVGMLRDKAVEEVAAALAREVDHWFPVTLTGTRGLEGGALRQRLLAAGVSPVEPAGESPVAGLEAARALAGVGDRILVFGSFHTVGAVLEGSSPAIGASAPREI